MEKYIKEKEKVEMQQYPYVVCDACIPDNNNEFWDLSYEKSPMVSEGLKLRPTRDKNCFACTYPPTDAVYFRKFMKEDVRTPGEIRSLFNRLFNKNLLSWICEAFCFREELHLDKDYKFEPVWGKIKMNNENREVEDKDIRDIIIERFIKEVQQGKLP